MPHYQRHCYRLRSLSSVHHYWHCRWGWHRSKHCVRAAWLHGWRSSRRRCSRRRPAKGHPVCRATTLTSLSITSACCTFISRRPSGGRAPRRTRCCAHPWGYTTSCMGPHAPRCSPCAALTNRASSCQNPPKIANSEPEIVQKRPAVTAVTAVARGRAAATLSETGKFFCKMSDFLTAALKTHSPYSKRCGNLNKAKRTHTTQ